MKKKKYVENNKYVLLPKDVTGEDVYYTYALGVDSIRELYDEGVISLQPLFTLDDGSTIARPLTFKETLEARVNDYERKYDDESNERSRDDRLRLFEEWLTCCTGIAYKLGSTRFKIVPVCEELISIDKNFNSSYLPVDYDSIYGIELDRHNASYNEWLTKSGVLEHEGWLALVEDDKQLLKTYADIVFKERKDAKRLFMAFWPRDKTAQQNDLRALFVGSIGACSYAGGYDDFFDRGRFVGIV